MTKHLPDAHPVSGRCDIGTRMTLELEHHARKLEADLFERSRSRDRIGGAGRQRCERAQRRNAIVFEGLARDSDVARDRVEHFAAELERQASIARAMLMRAFEGAAAAA